MPGGSFDAWYDPALRTATDINLPDIPPLGGLNLGSLAGLLRRPGRLESQLQGLRYAAPQAQPSPTLQKVRDFWTIKQDLDAVQSPDPWAGRGHGQVVGQTMFNMPAASALAYGQDIFPSGFDVYSDILRSSGGVDPLAQGRHEALTAGTTDVEYDPRTGQPSSPGRRSQASTAGVGGSRRGRCRRAGPRYSGFLRQHSNGIQAGPIGSGWNRKHGSAVVRLLFQGHYHRTWISECLLSLRCRRESFPEQ